MSETESVAGPQEGTEQPVPAPAEGTQPAEAQPAPAGAQPAEPAPEPPAEEAKEEQPPRQAWWQKRIDEITRARHEAERRADAAQRELERYRQPADPNAPPGQQPPAPANLTDAQIEERANFIASQREYQRSIARTIDAGNVKYGEPAFNAACNTLASLGANERPEFMQAVTELSNGADVLQHLGAHPEIAAPLMGLPPLRMAMELARLERQVTAPPAPKPLSRAPAPIAPIEGGVSQAEPDIYDPNISTERFIALRNKQENARRGRG